MPVIGRFYNIIIKMHYIENEHNPPHIHAKYENYEGVFSVKSEEMIRGNLPKTAKRLVFEFIKQHKDRLIEMWEKQNFEMLDFEEN